MAGLVHVRRFRSFYHERLQLGLSLFRVALKRQPEDGSQIFYEENPFISLPSRTRASDLCKRLLTLAFASQPLPGRLETSHRQAKPRSPYFLSHYLSLFRDLRTTLGVRL